MNITFYSLSETCVQKTAQLFMKSEINVIFFFVKKSDIIINRMISVFISRQRHLCLYNIVICNRNVYKCLVIFHYRYILVLTKSIISGHQLVCTRERLADKLEFICYDPLSK